MVTPLPGPSCQGCSEHSANLLPSPTEKYFNGLSLTCKMSAQHQQAREAHFDRRTPAAAAQGLVWVRGFPGEDASVCSGGRDVSNLDGSHGSHVARGATTRLNANH